MVNKNPIVIIINRSFRALNFFFNRTFLILNIKYCILLKHVTVDDRNVDGTMLIIINA